MDPGAGRNIVGGGVGAGGVPGPKESTGAGLRGFPGAATEGKSLSSITGQEDWKECGDQSQALAWGGDDWQKLLH